MRGGNEAQTVESWRPLCLIVYTENLNRIRQLFKRHARFHALRPRPLIIIRPPARGAYYGHCFNFTRIHRNEYTCYGVRKRLRPSLH
ncbi:hypothetical protein EVAR_75381_1 [Eumeta japonica]|uniref:Uncharacterized protein n=1 Tax=Eumeta variegata TaxID=151549 RepID=A0A4C1Y909_EUMVA|nr:hypothetical protein EVAR_75381_1 [Eumeta japonica]